LTGGKIISATCKVEYASNCGVLPNSPVAGYIYSFDHDATNANIALHATSSENILSKGIIVYIVYEE